MTGMSKMLNALWRNPFALSLIAGVLVVLSFPTIEWVPTIFFFPIFLNQLSLQVKSSRQAFFFGFLTSFFIMLGGFYWVVYVIHVFGYLPWSVSTLLYLVFCGFGALNFPLFLIAAYRLNQRVQWQSLSPFWQLTWLTVALPALFTFIEFLTPKLFPWFIGHTFYHSLWVNQIAELTGSAALTFGTYSLGSAFFWLVSQQNNWKQAWKPLWFPSVLWIGCIAFSIIRLQAPPLEGRTLRVGLIQANIGSLEKVKARRSGIGAVRHTIAQYFKLSEEALNQSPRPDLILWPETAIPFRLDGEGSWQRLVKKFVNDRNTTLITGAYSRGKFEQNRDNNAAFLLEPQPDGQLKEDIYRKNILLAFGEYFPGGDIFPQLYRWFPQVSHFERGREQNIFELSDKTRLGVTICYEAIVPSYYRKVVAQGVHAVVNLTNDSWFGPTAEPYQHGALSVFRAIESRVPLFRVTNTGTSFVVDHLGRMSRQTPVYGEGTLVEEVTLPRTPPFTFYQKWGNWFIWLCGGILILIVFKLSRINHAPLRH